MKAPHTPQRSYSQAEINDFTAKMMKAMTEKAMSVSTTTTPFYVHGSGGILAQPGQRADVVNAMILPIGLQGSLPWRLSRYQNEVYPILTGITDSSGSEPENACDNAPTPGNLKICNQTYPFGRLIRESQVVQADKAGLLLNNSDFYEHNLVGNPFTNLESPMPISFAEMLRNDVANKLQALWISWMMDFAPLIYTANPSNTTGQTGYIEYNGLDKLINTGYQDAYTGQACPSADSVIVDFGSSPVVGNETEIVTDITETLAYLKYLALRTGQGPVDYVLSMRYSLFRQLTDIWPCVYLTYRCTGLATGAQVNVDATMQINMRDNMRNGSYLLIDGYEVPVVIDEAITEDVPLANTYESDIYFIPLRSRGRPVTFYEYQDLNAPGGMRDITTAMTPDGSFQILGGGRYWLHRKPPYNECIQVRLGAKPRLILEMPFLAARLTNVRYSPLLFHERNPFPDGTYYHVDGGISITGTAPYFYPPTA